MASRALWPLGPRPGQQATGDSFDVAVIGIIEFHEEKIIGHWGVIDMAGMVGQIAVTGQPG